MVAFGSLGNAEDLQASWNVRGSERALIRHGAHVRPSDCPEPVYFHRERTKPFLVALADL